jgi:hypothetical protein
MVGCCKTCGRWEAVVLRDGLAVMPPHDGGGGYCDGSLREPSATYRVIGPPPASCRSWNRGRR